MLQFYNEALKGKADYGILYAHDRRQVLKLLLAGFDNLTSRRGISRLLDLAAAVMSSGNVEHPLMKEIKEALAPCVAESIEDLIKQLDTAAFDEALNAWREQCLAFDEFVGAFEVAIQQGHIPGSAENQLRAESMRYDFLPREDGWSVKWVRKVMR